MILIIRLLLAFSLFITVLMFQSCTASLMQKNAEFEDEEWIVQSINYNDISNADGKIFLKFNRSNRRLSGFGGCNTILGSYSISGSDISIRPARSKSNCPDLMETEDMFMSILEKAVEFREFTSSDKDYLRLMAADGSSIELRLKKNKKKH